MNIFGSKSHDFLAIGDIVVDDFIHLAEAEVESKYGGKKELCVSFGEKIPYASSRVVPAVGNSPNAAVCASHLGLNSALYANLGRDENGDLCIKTLKEAGVDTRFVIRHKDIRTNYHYVLWYQDDRTILIKHEKFPYDLPDLDEPAWVYLSSLGEHSLPFHEQIADWLDRHQNVRLAFQPGTYQIRFGPMKIPRIFKRSEYFFCNREEAGMVLDTRDRDVRHLAERIADLGPRFVFITDGPAGAYAYQAASRELYFMPIYPDPKPPVSRTGAGDAFSSTVTAGRILGLSLEESLKWAMINSMNVVQHVGAQTGLLSPSQIKHFLAKSPEDFKPRLI
jgi:sugar/nucleoside kinase (ribokinase family)